jgi:hypothetical protein
MLSDKEGPSEALNCIEKKHKESETREGRFPSSDDAGVKEVLKEVVEKMISHYEQQLMKEKNSIILDRITAELAAPDRLENATRHQVVELIRCFSAEKYRVLGPIMAVAFGKEREFGKRARRRRRRWGVKHALRS